MNKSLRLPDYHKKHWQLGELFIAVLKGGGVTFLLSYFFYRSIWAVLPLSVVGVLFVRYTEQDKQQKRIEELKLQFKECILSVSANMRAGYAAENAFMESRNDMKLLFGEKSMIYQELEGMRRGLQSNVTLEELLLEFAKRSANDDIEQFAQVFAIAKRGGGNLSEIIQTSVELIGKRVDAAQEIQTVLSGRKMELYIMKAMPFAIILYIGSTYPGYFDMLYHNLTGVLVMTVCLSIYLVAYVWGDKILQKIAKEMS